MICPQCHSENRAGAKFCDECGCKLPAPDPAPTPSSFDTEKTGVLKPVVLDRAHLPEIDIPGVNVAEDGSRFDDEFSEDDILADEAAEAEANAETDAAAEPAPDPESDDETGEGLASGASEQRADDGDYAVDYTGFDVFVSDEVPEPTASFDPEPRASEPVAEEAGEGSEDENDAPEEEPSGSRDTDASDVESAAAEGEVAEAENAAAEAEDEAVEDEELLADEEPAADEQAVDGGQAIADEAVSAGDDQENEPASEAADETPDAEDDSSPDADETSDDEEDVAAASDDEAPEIEAAASAVRDDEAEPSDEEPSSDASPESDDEAASDADRADTASTRALDNLPDPFDDAPDEDAQRAMDYGMSTERLVAADYVKPPRQTGRAGDTMEIPRVGDEPEQKRDFRAPREKGPNTAAKTAAAVLIALAVVGGGAAAATYHMELWGGKTVPDVVGMTQTDAQYLLESKGFSVRSTTVQSDETEGLVLLMDPGAHARQNPGTEVVIHVSEARVVPDVVGKSREEAQAAFDEDGYTNVSFTEELSDEPAGTVLTVSPEVGAKAHAGDAVSVTVAVPRTVPRVAGMTWDQAKAALEELGLAPQSASVYDDSVTEGTLTGTDPAPGTVCRAGDAVTVYVAKSRGTELVAAAKSYLGSVGSITVDGTQFNIQAVDAVEYAGNGTTTFSVTGQGVATASVLGETVTVAGQVRQVTGTITWDDANQPTGLSAK